MPFASAGLFEEFVHTRTWTGRAPSPAVTRLDQWYEGRDLLVEARLGPGITPRAVSLVRDGERLLLVSRLDGAVLSAVSADRPALWDRAQAEPRVGGLLVRVPVAGPGPARLAPRPRPDRAPAADGAARGWAARLRDRWSAALRRLRSPDA